MTIEIDKTRQKKTDLLQSAELPLPELSVKDGELVYKGQQWDNMSGSDRLKVSTAIVRKLNPKCGFVLLDKLEQMDTDTLNDLDSGWSRKGCRRLRPASAPEMNAASSLRTGIPINVAPQAQKTWKAGEF